jgi:hypothetical protein
LEFLADARPVHGRAPGEAQTNEARQGQICSRGLCSTPPPDTVCDPDRLFEGMDGCETNAL